MESLGDSISEDQIQSNIESLTQELEALSMTLTEKEFQVVSQANQETLIKLQILPYELEKELMIEVNAKQNQKFEFLKIKLPLISLDVTLSSKYPSHEAPKIKLTGFYSKYSSILIQALEEKWGCDQMVLYEWYSYCQQDLIPSLFQAFDGKLEIDQVDYQQFKEEEYDSVKFQLDTVEQSCGICYQNFIGKDNFLVLNGCLHYFCKECIKSYAEDLITRGEIGSLVCPQGGCKTYLNDINLKDINLSEELIQKYTTFSINQAIDKMEDFGWCPVQECGSPAEVDKLKNYGQCTQCRFTFCLTCREKYHFFKQCPSLKVGYEVKHKDQFESVTRKHVNQISEQLNLFYLQQCTKQCPQCKFAVQKTDGCNKMICSKCGIFFCWMCVSIIAGYDHFREFPNCGDILAANISDSLGDGEGIDFEKVEEMIVSKALTDCIKCPRCFSLNTRDNKINLIKCNQCQQAFCYQCGRLTPELMEHFEVTNCYYQEQTNPKISDPRGHQKSPMVH